MVRVAYVAGDGRSGTTLMSRILGAYPGCIAIGELYDIWAKMIEGKTLCGCGARFADCSFWNAVLHEAFGGADQIDPTEFFVLRSSVQAPKHLPLLLYPGLRSSAFSRRMVQYREILERLYLAIQTVSGCDVIVDSSKLAAYAVVLSESPAIDLSFIHMLRDSRACVYSWQRLKPEASAPGQTAYLPQRALFTTAMVWNARNLLQSLISRRMPSSATIVYESFVRQPRAVVTALAEGLGLDVDNGPWVDDCELIASQPNHIFAGNPNRVERGAIRIRADEEWRSRMPREQQALVFALTLPALWKLGYLSTPDMATA